MFKFVGNSPDRESTAITKNNTALPRSRIGNQEYKKWGIKGTSTNETIRRKSKKPLVIAEAVCREKCPDFQDLIAEYFS
jgi:hypothetical protein